VVVKGSEEKEVSEWKKEMTVQIEERR